MTNLGDVSPGESLGRGVFSSRRRERAVQRGKIPFDVFLHRAGETDISVDRLDYAGSDAAIRIADKVAKGRGARFYGWAVIEAGRAADDGRRIVATPRIGNCYHADIVLPSTVVDNWEEQKHHARELAGWANWRERSEQWPAKVDKHYPPTILSMCGRFLRRVAICAFRTVRAYLSGRRRTRG